jgi:hypothetical protein
MTFHPNHDMHQVTAAMRAVSSVAHACTASVKVKAKKQPLI